MKRKFLLPILSVCMVVALVSVGFAAWLITGNDTSGATGSFVTYDVTNDYFTVTATAEDADKTITFGKNGTPSNPWLTVDNVPDQDLEATFTITITPDVPFSDTRGVAAVLGDNKSIQVKLTGPAEYETAVTDNYVVYPTMKYNEEAAVSVASGKTLQSEGVVLTIPATAFTVESTNKATATATVIITFAWGSAFGGGNPYTYYNAEGNTQTIRLAATTALNALNGLNGKQYTLALEVVDTPQAS